MLLIYLPTLFPEHHFFSELSVTLHFSFLLLWCFWVASAGPTVTPAAVYRPHIERYLLSLGPSECAEREWLKFSKAVGGVELAQKCICSTVLKRECEYWLLMLRL
ncbi:d6.4 [Tranosema rostrale ichnovirus]|nr:d6.4 [Tranosema rostrale ichnovirus]